VASPVPRTGHPYLDEPRQRGEVLALAHRGGVGHPALAGLENTRTAFASAVGLGYRYLETDVHATRDGHVVAFHDDSLERLTGVAGSIQELSYAEVAGLRVSGREPVPRLVDLLEEFPGTRWNLDLKSPGAVAPLVALVTRLGLHDRVCVGSFAERVLRRFHARLRAEPGSRRVATVCGVPTVVVARYAPGGSAVQRLLRDPGSTYQVPVAHRGIPVLDRRFVERSHAQGRHVHVWTVNERAEMERLVDLGVDGLITDRTDLLRDVLRERGLWGGA